MAELADALASGASDRKVVEVRVLFRAPIFPKIHSRISYGARRPPLNLRHMQNRADGPVMVVAVIGFLSAVALLAD